MLHTLCLNGAKPETIKAFIENEDVDINGSERIKGCMYTPLGCAQTVEVAKVLIENGGDVNKEFGSSTPLGLVAGRNPELARYYVEAGAVITYQCLQRAILGNQLETVKMFIDAGVDLNPKHFELAAEVSIEMMQCLLEGGADVTKGDPLHRALKSYRTGINERVAFLINAGVDASRGNPLYRAMSKSTFTLETMKLLVDNGAPVNKAGLEGTPLFVAICDHNVDRVKFLLANGADLRMYKRITPLGYAACQYACCSNTYRSERKQIVSLLLKAGADPEKVSSRNKDYVDEFLKELEPQIVTKQVADRFYRIILLDDEFCNYHVLGSDIDEKCEGVRYIRTENDGIRLVLDYVDL